MGHAAELPPLLRINNDVLHELCEFVRAEERNTYGVLISVDVKSLKSLASTCKHLRALVAPEIFGKITIRIRRDLDWHKASEAIPYPVQGVDVQVHAKKCVLEMYSGGADRRDSPSPRPRPRTTIARLFPRVRGAKEPSDKPPLHVPPPSDLPLRLAASLSSMRNLRTATLVLPPSHAHVFRQACEDVKLSLPAVETLAIGPAMEWLVSMCPNVSTVSTYGGCGDDLWTLDGTNRGPRDSVCKTLLAASTAKRLQSFELVKPGCEEWMVSAIHAFMPDIPRLVLSNKRGWLPRFQADEEGQDADSKLLGDLSKFSELRVLAIVGIVEFDPWPWFGNSWYDPGVPECYAQLKQQHYHAQKKAAEFMFAACARFEVLWTEWDDAWEVERLQNGAIAVRKIENSGYLDANCPGHQH